MIFKLILILTEWLKTLTAGVSHIIREVKKPQQTLPKN